MTSSRGRTLFRRLSMVMMLTAALAVAGCNVRPLYGSSASGAGDSVAESLASVHVDRIADQSGQTLRGFLVQALSPNGRPADPAFILSVDLTESEQSLGIARDDTATRANLFVTANSTLRDAATGREVWGDSRTVIASYGILAEQFATIIAERSARERALRQIAQEVRTAMALLFQRGIPEPEPESAPSHTAPATIR